MSVVSGIFRDSPTQQICVHVPRRALGPPHTKCRQPQHCGPRERHRDAWRNFRRPRHVVHAAFGVIERLCAVFRPCSCCNGGGFTSLAPCLGERSCSQASVKEHDIGHIAGARTEGNWQQRALTGLNERDGVDSSSVPTFFSPFLLPSSRPLPLSSTEPSPPAPRLFHPSRSVGRFKVGAEVVDANSATLTASRILDLGSSAQDENLEMGSWSRRVERRLIVIRVMSWIHAAVPAAKSKQSTEGVHEQ